MMLPSTQENITNLKIHFKVYSPVFLPLQCQIMKPCLLLSLYFPYLVAAQGLMHKIYFLNREVKYPAEHLQWNKQDNEHHNWILQIGSLSPKPFAHKCHSDQTSATHSSLKDSPSLPKCVTECFHMTWKRGHHLSSTHINGNHTKKSPQQQSESELTKHHWAKLNIEQRKWGKKG